ncbi:MAG: septum site-determining protein MinC, partial [Halothiobacillaceae bacterium]
APRERSARPSVATPQATLATAPTTESSATKVIYQPIRSGQQIYAKGGDLIVLAAVNAGAEIIADGNIHIYAPLRGRALAGVRGNNSARIFCYNMEAELVAVAGHYRVFEERVPSEFRNKAVQIYLDNEQLKIELLT